MLSAYGVPDAIYVDRNLRIERYTPLVERIARQMLVRLPPSVTWDELLSAGYIGLIEAVDRFDSDRNVEFSAFARTRIRGAMLDALRELDLLPRSVREKLNAIQRTHRALEQQLGRKPDDDELAQALGVPVAQLHDVQRYQLQTNLVSFDETPQDQEGERRSVLDLLVDDQALTGDALLELNEAKNNVRDAFDGLPERLRLLIVLYYVEALTMQEIAVVMSVTVGRISQLHRQAIERLRDELGSTSDVDRRRLALLFKPSVHTDS